MSAPAIRLRLAALAALAAAHLVVSLVAVTPGYLSIDEATYHLMAKNLAERGDLEVWNGYRELPSPELVAASIVAHDGRLVGRPPVLYPALAVPFYLAWGYRGLFALNAAAFAGVVVLTFALARRLFGDRALALDSCLVLVAASFAWEYSQAAWTHATALLFNLGAVTLAVAAIDQPGRARRRWLALAAGMAAGLGIGVRLDLVLVLAAVVGLYVFRSPWQPDRALAAVAGALPPLAVWSLVNLERFGIFSPLSMGLGTGLPELARYLPFLAVAAGLAAGVWTLTRQPVRHRLAGRRRAVWLAVGLAGLLALALPQGRRLALQQARGGWTLGVDLRALDRDRREPAMRRGTAGEVVYAGGLKKALLQSCPYLVVLLWPARRLVRGGRERQRLALALVVPAAFFAFYAQFSWHGGLALNLRYLTALLPYAAILTAWALHRLARRAAGGVWPALTAGGGAAVAAYLLAAGDDAGRLLTLPLVLAGALAAALVAAARGGRRATRAAIGLAAAGLAWAALTAFTYDYPRARALRRANLETAAGVAPLVARDALFFADFVDPFFALIEHGRVRIARPSRDGYRDMPRLAAYHLAAGRPVYGALDRRLWQRLERGPLAGFERRTLWDDGRFVLAELSADGAIDTPRRGH